MSDWILNKPLKVILIKFKRKEKEKKKKKKKTLGNQYLSIQGRSSLSRKT